MQWIPSKNISPLKRGDIKKLTQVKSQCTWVFESPNKSTLGAGAGAAVDLPPTAEEAVVVVVGRAFAVVLLLALLLLLLLDMGLVSGFL